MPPQEKKRVNLCGIFLDIHKKPMICSAKKATPRNSSAQAPQIKQIVQLIKFYLSNRKISVRIENQISSKVSQDNGSVLSSLLFNIMIADLHKNVKHVKVKQFASLLGKVEVCKTSNPNRPKIIGIDKIQEDLHKIMKWFNCKGFKLSTTKIQAQNRIGIV